MRQAVLAVILAATLSACATSGGDGVRPLEQAFAASTRPVSANIVNALAGGLIGGSLGAGLDQRERRRALEAEYRALEYTPAGQPVNWGEAGGRRGEVMAGAPYRVGSQDCRQYTHTVDVNGRTQTARGSACRNSDGSWSFLV